ncbi:hypothetical protein NIIDMKKI_23630 [Mycobacterium kansasii]|uniref:Uncharacterized protein n=1 Tax=Mycobacterium kansasii TaxID=1768 RepID=A0A7G1I860_MYCKA|nr:hypothetical protein NIIDMKKI_23630 [Mycobacterium kansasii]
MAKWPATRPVPSGGSPLGAAGEAGRSGVQVGLKFVNQGLLHWYAAVLVALAVHVNDNRPVSRSDVSGIGAHEFVRAKAGEHRRQHDSPVAFGPVGAALRTAVVVDDRQQLRDRLGSKSFGSVLATLSRPTNDIGLAALMSPV